MSQCGEESQGILEGQHSTSPLTGIEKVCDEMFTFIDKLSGENIDLLAASLHSSSSETVQEKAVNMIAACCVELQVVESRRRPLLGPSPG